MNIIRMSKKLVNKVEDVVDEALSGMVAVHPGLQRLEGHRVVIRADTNLIVKEGKVRGNILLND